MPVLSVGLHSNNQNNGFRLLCTTSTSILVSRMSMVMTRVMVVSVPVPVKVVVMMAARFEAVLAHR
jgi:hypothetical protein